MGDVPASTPSEPVSGSRPVPAPERLSPARLPFAATAFDRDAVDRELHDVRVLAAQDPTTLVLVLAGGLAPVAGDALVLVPAAELPAVPHDPRRPEVYLGRLPGADGAPGPRVLLRAVAAPEPGREDAAAEPFAVPEPLVAAVTAFASGRRGEELRWAGLRELGPVLPTRDTSLLVTAQSVGLWHRDHPRCPQCGEPTEVIRSGWARRCPNDESLHFPRTDPAIIVAVSDGDPDPDRERLLLGRSALWKGNRFSTLAGFVEPGESLEQAVVREVAEEAGLTVGDVQYLGSQPWPFPRSLMLGCRAVVRSGAAVPDGQEILELRWFTRAQLREAARTGSVTLPGRVSIAHALIAHWLGEDLPETAW
ncbi:NAD(+) diphosphatase [Kocuria rosea]|nr:NAD(+) diphosphatase [Kocuria rosea]QCY32590.1 NAD(+) diphosphatase [Kocuria rosea]TQN34637.1 NAD+ diphosphatase [Kocuria rosea]